MAREALIRKKAVQILEADKWVVWYASKVRFRSNDIFGVFDLICSRKSRIRFIQLTTTPNLSARRKKIEAFLTSNSLKIPNEVWGYSNKHRSFKIVKIC